jgi:hypothetical protein
MMKSRVLETLFFANAIVLLAHQIDAAFWHEWVLFGLPGGIQFFLLLNLPIIALVLYGQRCLALGRPSGKAFSWALAASGLFAAVFHGFHLLRGDEAFRLPFSLALLVATFVLSLAQALGLMFLKEGDAGDHRKGEI